ncbi:MAG: (E)-4-hydroxy-3-methylbut-2-enyl-diphosphate synthase [Elusimicrobia bacterium]|nr:(E)-4-hydroxy-3-methylbut-2-enyl-diphosphate synthase [Elusimicrobiota bacterium]
MVLRFSENLLAYRRRKTRVVRVGGVAVGGDNPLRLQSMTTTPTSDTQATVAQAVRLAEAGCEIVRITAPTEKDAENLKNIQDALRRQGVQVPLVADIHFRPDAALIAADYVEKVRINPGNFADAKAFKIREYTEEEYRRELDRIEEKFTPLVLKLKRLMRSLRIGVNHGSLSDRILNRFGDTPEGMVESALEFVRICESNGYHDIILSMKASNPKVMIAAYRLLAARMGQEGMDYPFHLGVTEAGEGEDGRIKSAIGIGALLEDGIGDTLRVSLTEEPELEIPVARRLAAPYSGRTPAVYLRDPVVPGREVTHMEDFTQVSRRKTREIQMGPLRLGAGHPIRVALDLSVYKKNPSELLLALRQALKAGNDQRPEILQWTAANGSDLPALQHLRRAFPREGSERPGFLVRVEGPLSLLSEEVWETADAVAPAVGGVAWEEDLRLLAKNALSRGKTLFLSASDADDLLERAQVVRSVMQNIVLCLEPSDVSRAVHQMRYLAAQGWIKDGGYPFHLKAPSFNDPEDQLLHGSVLIGSLLSDGVGDSVQAGAGTDIQRDLELAYNILQGTGVRITKAEFVSCPSCGRTLFDLQEATERIKSKTGHLKNVKIAIMGCIVNGTGEMSYADFGYVGVGPGKINLYAGKTCVEKGIPADVADEKLVELIKEHGKWVDPLKRI